MVAPVASVLSLFSGLGGLDLGLEAAGMQTLGCLELDDTARQTLLANRPGWGTVATHDVLDAAQHMAPRDIGVKRRGLDVLAGGPPCQPFSKAAQWNTKSLQGMDDPRARPVHGMLDLIDRFLPKVVLIENVAGFLDGKVSARATIEHGLKRINTKNGTDYRISARVVNAADYGVPQNRMRAIAVARRDGKPFVFPAATHQDAPITAWDALHQMSRVDWSPPTGSWTELLPCIPEGSNYLHLTERGDGPELFGWRTRYWSFLLKLARDRPSWTIPASPGPNTGPFHWDNRPLTPAERMRLQSFPDTWKLLGSHRAQIRMAGNATPPVLAEAIGRAVIDQMGFGSKTDRASILDAEPTLTMRRATKPAHAAPPRATLPEHFRPMVGSKPAHPGTGQGPAPRAAA